MAVSPCAFCNRSIWSANLWRTCSGLGLWAGVLLHPLAARSALAGCQSRARERPRWRTVPAQRYRYHGYRRCLRFYLCRPPDPFRGQRLYGRAVRVAVSLVLSGALGAAGVIAMEPGRYLAVVAICLVGFSPVAHLYWHRRPAPPVSVQAVWSVALWVVARRLWQHYREQLVSYGG